jgi:hypothetical protein
VALPSKTAHENPARVPAIWPVLWLGAGLVGVVLLAGLAWTARQGPPTWPVSDRALIEIYTMHAARGAQLLGAYSQYGWYHPGPLLFYLLAPFYIAGARTVHGLNVGALAINIGSLLPVAWILGRRRGLSPGGGLLVLLSLLVYVVRTADLLTSTWNPHVSVWPFAALLVCSTAVISGDLSLLPLWVVFASLVMQTHVGFAPVALTLGTLTIAAFIWRAAAGRLGNQGWSIALLSLVILQLIWLPVFAD